MSAQAKRGQLEAVRQAGRVPPQNLDAERAVIGGIFTFPDAVDEMLEVMAPADCYSPKHRHVLEAVVALDGRNEKPDRVTVGDELERMGALAGVGGRLFLEECEAWTPGGLNIRQHARIVREKAMLRRLTEAAHAMAAEAYEGEGNAGDIVDRAEQRVMAVRDHASRASDTIEARALMRATMKEIERDYERGEQITGTPTGIEALDRMTSGFQAGELVILAARPGQGKTTAGMNWADHVAVDLGRAVLALSMEMPKEQIGKRQLAARARIDLQRIKTGQLIESDWQKLAHAAGQFADAPLSIDEGRNLSALDVRAKARRWKRRWIGTSTQLGLIVLDYLTLMREDERAETKSIAVGRNAAALKNLAKELAVPVLCLAQLNRDNSKGGRPRKPILSDLRDSGEIEQHADVVIFLHHEQDKDNERPNIVEIVVDKNRNGPPGTVKASHCWEHCRIESLDGSPAIASGKLRCKNWTDDVPNSEAR